MGEILYRSASAIFRMSITNQDPPMVLVDDELSSAKTTVGSRVQSRYLGARNWLGGKLSEPLERSRPANIPCRLTLWSSRELQ